MGITRSTHAASRSSDYAGAAQGRSLTKHDGVPVLVLHDATTPSELAANYTLEHTRLVSARESVCVCRLHRATDARMRWSARVFASQVASDWRALGLSSGRHVTEAAVRAAIAL